MVTSPNDAMTAEGTPTANSLRAEITQSGMKDSGANTLQLAPSTQPNLYDRADLSATAPAAVAAAAAAQPSVTGRGDRQRRQNDEGDSPSSNEKEPTLTDVWEMLNKLTSTMEGFKTDMQGLKTHLEKQADKDKTIRKAVRQLQARQDLRLPSQDDRPPQLKPVWTEDDAAKMLNEPDLRKTYRNSLPESLSHLTPRLTRTVCPVSPEGYFVMAFAPVEFVHEIRLLNSEYQKILKEKGSSQDDNTRKCPEPLDPPAIRRQLTNARQKVYRALRTYWKTKSQFDFNVVLRSLLNSDATQHRAYVGTAGPQADGAG
ncbi:unnamed protein product [Sphagnum tenellum]